MSGLTTEPSPQDRALADAQVITENAYASAIIEDIARVHSYQTQVASHMLAAGVPGNVVLKLADEHAQTHANRRSDRIVEVDINGS